MEDGCIQKLTVPKWHLWMVQRKVIEWFIGKYE